MYAVVADEDDTPTLRQALDSDDYESIWKPALKREMKTLFDNGVLVLTPTDQLPRGARVLHGHVILTKKDDTEGAFVKGKARLVIQGNRQKVEFGDYDPSDLASYVKVSIYSRPQEMLSKLSCLLSSSNKSHE